MALKSCIYCNQLISELATSCPKCDKLDPFDEMKRVERELREKGKKDLEKRLQEYIKCKECGHSIKIADLFRGKSKIKIDKCPNCGFPDNIIECFVCGREARYYDPYQENFTCFAHFSEKCRCGRFVIGINKKLEYGFRNSYGICESCYNKKKYSEFIKNFPISFIFRPLGFGIVFFFLIGTSGFIIRLLLGHNFFKSIDNSLSFEGFIGFFIGVIWAIVKRNELD